MIKSELSSEKLDFWKICICYYELAASQYIKDFSDDFNKRDVLIVYNEMHQHLEDFQNSMIQCFPN